MYRSGRVFCRSLIFIAFCKIFCAVAPQAYARNFIVKYVINTDISDEELASVGIPGKLGKQEHTAATFKLIKDGSDAIEYTFHPMLTTITYMYGDIMILMQHLAQTQNDDYRFHLKFLDDDESREFQQLLNPTSLLNFKVVAHPLQLKLIDETERTADRTLSTRSVTVVSSVVKCLHMKVFMIVEGLPGRDDTPQAYLIFPDRGFYVTEPHGKEIILFPFKGESWKYVLRFAYVAEANRFAEKMLGGSKGRTLVALDSEADWSRYFSP